MRCFLRLAALTAFTCLTTLPVSAQGSAVLVGLRFDRLDVHAVSVGGPYADSVSRPAYQTFLFSQETNGTVLRAREAGLVVPALGTLWRVDGKRSAYNAWVEDFLWSAEIGTRPNLAGVPVFNGEHCDGYRAQTLRFAGDGYLGVEQITRGYCEDAAHPWNYETLALVPIDSTTHLGLPIDSVLGRPGRDALDAAAAEYTASIEDETVRAFYSDFPDRANWTIVHRQGAWIARGRIDTEEATDSTYQDFDLAVVLPPELADESSTPFPWDRIAQQIPSALDAFASPDGKMLFALHPTEITVHPIESDRIGPPFYTAGIEGPASLVMIRWSSDPEEIGRWHAALTPSARAARSIRP